MQDMDSLARPPEQSTPLHASGLSRRRFVQQLPLATAALAASCSTQGSPRPLRFGVITDVHQDVMHDGVERISAFVEAMNDARPDFVVQLGDFCIPDEQNRAFLAAWNRFNGPRYHVLGNHDMDGGFTREQAVAFLGMPARYHAFHQHGVQFVVLDGNDPGGSAPGYKRYIGPEQRDWLASILNTGSEPVVIFVHQALDHPSGIENREEIRALLAQPRLPDGSPRVLAVLCGHHHQDWTHTLSGTHHLQINSASYQWVGDKYAHDSYPPDVLQSNPDLRMTCPYQDSLWTLVTLDLHVGRLLAEGRNSIWVGPSPTELGVPRETLPPETCIPAIRSRRLVVHRNRPWKV